MIQVSWTRFLSVAALSDEKIRKAQQPFNKQNYEQNKSQTNEDRKQSTLSLVTILETSHFECWEADK